PRDRRSPAREASPAPRRKEPARESGAWAWGAVAVVVSALRAREPLRPRTAAARPRSAEAAPRAGPARARSEGRWGSRRSAAPTARRRRPAARATRGGPPDRTRASSADGGAPTRRATRRTASVFRVRAVRRGRALEAP